MVALFLAGPEQLTLPRQMFNGIRENISPTIAAVATLLIIFTTSLLLSTNAVDWTDQGLLPPGVPEPSYLHGMAVYPLPQLARAGSNVVMVGDALKPDEMGVGLYVAKPL